ARFFNLFLNVFRTFCFLACFCFTLVAQIRNDMSNKRKAEARQKAERAENIKKNDKNPA
ncbi:hypothetical protein PSZ20_23020, partial [Shigella flexneri]|nr:hypothetical protein [Shigella flexneri]